MASGFEVDIDLVKAKAKRLKSKLRVEAEKAKQADEESATKRDRVLALPLSSSYTPAAGPSFLIASPLMTISSFPANSSLWQIHCPHNFVLVEN